MNILSMVVNGNVYNMFLYEHTKTIKAEILYSNGSSYILAYDEYRNELHKQHLISENLGIISKQIYILATP